MEIAAGKGQFKRWKVQVGEDAKAALLASKAMLFQVICGIPTEYAPKDPGHSGVRQLHFGALSALLASRAEAAPPRSLELLVE